MRVWIGCLACYNEGTLRGQWYDASEAGEVTPEELHLGPGHRGVNPGTHPHEELWVMDTDGMPSGYRGEMSPMDAQAVADAMADIERALDDDEAKVEAYFAWVSDHYGQPPTSELADYLSDFGDHFRGIRESFREYADEWADEMLGVPATPCSGEVWNAAMRELGSALEFAVSYFDYEAHARTLEMEMSTYDVTGGVAIFSA